MVSSSESSTFAGLRVGKFYKWRAEIRNIFGSNWWAPFIWSKSRLWSVLPGHELEFCIFKTRQVNWHPTHINWTHIVRDIGDVPCYLYNSGASDHYYIISFHLMRPYRITLLYIYSLPSVVNHIVSLSEQLSQLRWLVVLRWIIFQALF